MKVAVAAWLLVAACLFVFLAGQVPSGDWSRVDWIGIPGVLGFGIAALVFASPVFMVTALLTTLAQRLRRRPSM